MADDFCKTRVSEHWYCEYGWWLWHGNSWWALIYSHREYGWWLLQDKSYWALIYSHCEYGWWLLHGKSWWAASHWSPESRQPPPVLPCQPGILAHQYSCHVSIQISPTGSSKTKIIFRNTNGSYLNRKLQMWNRTQRRNLEPSPQYCKQKIK